MDIKIDSIMMMIINKHEKNIIALPWAGKASVQVELKN
jgi:hypothetical protein